MLQGVLMKMLKPFQHGMNLTLFLHNGTSGYHPLKFRLLQALRGYPPPFFKLLLSFNIINISSSLSQNSRFLYICKEKGSRYKPQAFTFLFICNYSFVVASAEVEVVASFGVEVFTLCCEFFKALLNKFFKFSWL